MRDFIRKKLIILKSSSVLILLFLATLNLFANSYIGTATCPIKADLEEQKKANDIALSEMLSQIAVSVQSDFTNSIEENVSANETEFKRRCESILKTYSSASLTNAKLNKRRTDKEIIFQWSIPKSEVQKIFSSRLHQAEGLFFSAEEAESKNQLEQALRWFYQADLLFKSVPATFQQNQNGVNELSCIKKITKILNGLDFKLKDDWLEADSRKISFETLFQNKPVSSLKVHYDNGFDWIPTEVNHSELLIWLDGSAKSKNEVVLEIEYKFSSHKDQNSTVSEIWDLVAKPKFDSRKGLSFAKESQPKLEPKIEPQKPRDFGVRIAFEENSPKGFKENSPKNCASLVKQFKDEKINDESIFADKFAIAKAKDILRLTKPKPQSENFNLKSYKNNEGWEVREIPVSLSKKGLKGIVDNLVVDFDENGKITDVNFSIGEADFQRFYEIGQEVEDWEKRQKIVKFLETFKTAYNSRQIEAVEQMYSDNAEIIVGKVIKSQPLSVEIKSHLPQERIEYLHFTKQDYIRRLGNIFSENVNSFLYYQYDQLEVIKGARGSEIYGVHVRQNYISQNYADEGYLCLVINFGEEPPLIHVRAWLPQEWSEEQLIKVTDFEIK
ncbi:MAG: hypothetical protein DWQ06_10515 [Calditrichaeota bacterium]|nr:MAG: hypothetical protein DWQ06_10515 [Calditrichota bacterium]